MKAQRDTPIDVDAILASLDPALADPGDNPWGSANLILCGGCPACRDLVR